jgi:multidrug efflux pump subunit AcrA (membrane-fusion protein)
MHHPPKPLQIFRPEAVAYRERPGTTGRLLQIQDDWTHSFLWLLAFTGLVTLVFACAFRVCEYASGPGVVRLTNARAVTVARGGIVEALLVEPGQEVEEGAPLLQLNDAEEVAELARIEAELESNLARLLRDPGNSSAKEAMTGLSARRETALSASFPGVLQPLSQRCFRDATVLSFDQDKLCVLRSMVPRMSTPISSSPA